MRSYPRSLVFRQPLTRMGWAADISDLSICMHIKLAIQTPWNCSTCGCPEILRPHPSITLAAWSTRCSELRSHALGRGIAWRMHSALSHPFVQKIAHGK